MGYSSGDPSTWPAIVRDMPPTSVRVDLIRAMSWAGRIGANPPLRVRAGGLKPHHDVPGTLTAWAKMWDGQWAGLVELDVTSPNGLHRVRVRILVPADSITPVR